MIQTIRYQDEFYITAYYLTNKQLELSISLDYVGCLWKMS